MAAQNEQDGAAAKEQFAAQTMTAEDELKSQTVGLVTLSDFRKRRAEIAEQKELESRTASGRGTPLLSSGVTTPRDGSSPKPTAKKRKKTATAGKLSFGLDEGDEDRVDLPKLKKASKTHPELEPSESQDDSATSIEGRADAVRKIRPNASISYAPKAMTKSAMIKDAEAKEKLRKDYLAMQDLVRNTEIIVPFVFYDGKDVPGSVCKMKKGDPIWLFLDRARKFGAERGASGADKARRDWARISVDDLMLVRGDIIVPPVRRVIAEKDAFCELLTSHQHYEFYYFITNRSHGYQGLLFDYSDKADSSVPQDTNPQTQGTTDLEDIKDMNLEGRHHDPHKTKVVDRRWYEKNKHIFPASAWEDFEPEKDYTAGARRDKGGNAYFFS